MSSSTEVLSASQTSLANHSQISYTLALVGGDITANTFLQKDNGNVII